jgi:hypothetical protein
MFSRAGGSDRCPSSAIQAFQPFRAFWEKHTGLRSITRDAYVVDSVGTLGTFAKRQQRQKLAGARPVRGWNARSLPVYQNSRIFIFEAVHSLPLASRPSPEPKLAPELSHVPVPVCRCGPRSKRVRPRRRRDALALIHAHGVEHQCASARCCGCTRCKDRHATASPCTSRNGAVFALT